MLAMAPGMQIVVAHLGGREHVDYFRLAQDHPIAFDTAMAGVNWPGFDPLTEEALGNIRRRPELFLFGSDFPSIPYAWEHQAEVVKSWGLGVSAERLVFAENARRLFRLGTA